VLQDLKKFLMRGNVVDLAVAVVIGAAFGLVVSSFVDNIINPIVAAVAGERDLSEVAAITLREGDVPEEDAVLRIGAFVQQVLDFLIIGTALFFVVKAFEKLQERRAEQDLPDEETPTPSDEAMLLSEIRDLLKAQRTQP
jgi:large conductance mechanosensitive channel